MPNIKRTKTKFQKGGSSGKPSGKSSKSEKNIQNNSYEGLVARLTTLQMPDVPGTPIKIPKSYKLPDLATYIDNIRDNLKKPLDDEISADIYLKLGELTSEKNAYDLIHRMRMIYDVITNKTDSLSILKQRYKKQSDKDVIELWITFFYRLKILIMDEKDKLYALIKDIKP